MGVLNEKMCKISYILVPNVLTAFYFVFGLLLDTLSFLLLVVESRTWS